MAKFLYKGKNRDGKPVRDTLIAGDRNDARRKLISQGYAITALSEQVDNGSDNDIFAHLFKPKANLILAFIKQMAFLLKAGVPLNKSLSVVAEQTTDKRFQEVLQLAIRDLTDGHNFSEALNRHPHVFSHLIISTIRVSEINGRIVESLETLAHHLEREHEFKAKMISAFTYPALVILMAVGVVVIMLTWVFPQFMSVFQEVNVPLPLPTRILIACSGFLTGHFKLIIFFIVCIGFGFFRLRKKPEIRAFWDRAKFKIPIFGEIIKKYVIVRLTSSLGTLLKSGVSIIEAIKLTSDVIRNDKIQVMMKRATAMIAEGQQIAYAFSQGDFLPQFVTQTIAIGEQSGQLPEILMDLSGHYDLELQEKAHRVSSAIEPAMLIFLGSIVALMAVSVIIPLFRMPSMIKSAF